MHSKYNLIETKTIPEIASKVYILQHKQSQAKLMLMPNEDIHKSFTISFRTPPTNHYGCAHIMEHSVLNGSKKYPLKEPFVDLLKSSLATFLNAFTFPDKTMYPVSSCNMQDFENLVDVYLDAVFNPLLKEEVFLQEGWHHILEQNKLQIQGVVYNEMKGVYSKESNHILYNLNKKLFADSCYRYESGGHPDYITKLTYNFYKKFHKKYYHAQNCFIHLYGNFPITEYLDKLDNYLKEYTYDPKKNIDIKPAKNYTTEQKVTCKYPATTNEDQCYVVWAYRLENKTPYHALAWTILEDILIGNDNAILTKIILESNLCFDNFSYGFDYEKINHTFLLGAKYIKKNNIKKLEKLIENKLQELSQNGIDKLAIESSINNIEFNLKESNFGSYPKGVIYAINSMASWLYSDDSSSYLEYENNLKKIKNNTAIFTDLIKKYLLNNNNKITLTSIADNSLQQKTALKNDKKLQELLHNLNHKILKENKQKLLDYQQSEDNPKDSKKLPILNKNNLTKQAQSYDLTCHNIDYKFLHTKISSDVCYNSIIFKSDNFSLEDIFYCKLLAKVFFKLGTNKKDAQEIQQNINLNFGSLYASSKIINHNNPSLILSFESKLFIQNTTKLFNLIEECSQNLNLTNEKLLYKILRTQESKLQTLLEQNGSAIVLNTLQKNYSLQGLLNYKTSFVFYHKFIKDLLNNFENKKHEIFEKLKLLKNKLICQENFTVHLSSVEKHTQSFKKASNIFFQNLPKNETTSCIIDNSFSKKNIMYLNTGQVYTVGKSFNIYDNYQYHGSLHLLEHILNNVYLWNEVRAKQGAYGCFCNFNFISGMFAITSYRDPNLTTTLQTYDNISNFLRELKFTNNEFNKLFIGSFASLDRPLTDQQQGQLALRRHLNNINFNDIQQARDELYSTTLANIKEYSEVFASLKQGIISVHGPKEKYLENKNIFDKVYNI